MNRVFIFILIITVFVQMLSAQTQSFYKLYPELDTNYSQAHSLLFDSTGYYILYYAPDVVLGNTYQTYIARFDTNHVLQWLQPYFTGIDGNSTACDLLNSSDSCLVFCGGTISEPRKGYIVKANKQNGSSIFIKTYGDTSRYYFEEIIETSDNGYLIVGATDSLNPSGLLNLYLLKTDQNGYKQWDTVIIMQNTKFFNSDIIRINETYYFTVGKKRTQNNIDDSKLIGVKEDGSIVLNIDIVLATYGGYLGGICVTKDNQILLGGQKNDYYYPDGPGVLNDYPFGRMYIGKYDTLGNLTWEKEYFILNSVQYTSEIISTSDGYILGGGCGWGNYYKGTGIDYHEPSTSFQDVFYMKINEDGDSIWNRIHRIQDGCWEFDNYWLSQDIIEDMVITPDGGIASTGWFWPVAAISWEWEQYAWVLKTDSNGCGKPGTPYGLWREELPYNQDSSIVHLTWLDDDTTNCWHHVQGSKDGQYYFWELTPRPVTNKEFFDTVPKYHTYCYRVFGLDSTWARTCESSEICITTGIEEYGPETGLLSVYPNPATDIINCVLPDNDDYEIVVYDALGSNITNAVTERSRSDNSNGTISLNISLLQPGIYFIEAKGKKILRGRFVKN